VITSGLTVGPARALEGGVSLGVARLPREFDEEIDERFHRVG
jgi:hypothetical protein